MFKTINNYKKYLFTFKMYFDNLFVFTNQLIITYCQNVYECVPESVQCHTFVHIYTRFYTLLSGAYQNKNFFCKNWYEALGIVTLMPVVVHPPFLFVFDSISIIMISCFGI